MTGAGPEHSAALVRLLDLLASGRPADARAVAAALPEEDLAAAVDAAGDRVSLPVRDYILSEGGSRSLIALARHAVSSGVYGGVSTMDRVLLRFDPEADAAFFDFDASLPRVWRARHLILCLRKGPDGHAVIPPRVKQALLDAVADTEPNEHLRNELALADDPDLVTALIPYVDRLSCEEKAKSSGRWSRMVAARTRSAIVRCGPPPAASSTFSGSVATARSPACTGPFPWTLPTWTSAWTAWTPRHTSTTTGAGGPSATWPSARGLGSCCGPGP